MKVLVATKPAIKVGQATARSLERAGSLSFKDYVQRAYPGTYKWLPHHVQIADAFQGLLDGTLELPDGTTANKLYVAAPPQSGKSTEMQLGCAYMLHRFGDIPLIAAMHNDPKTKRFSWFVRKFYDRGGGQLTTKPIHNWHTAQGGEFNAIGKGSSPSGIPAAAIFTDDLLGGRRESMSRLVFEDDLLWYTTELLRRRTVVHSELGRFVQISIGTLWSLCDIQAYMLGLGGWYVVRCPGICDTSRKLVVMVGPFPGDEEGINKSDRPWEAPNCRVVPDPRADGEGLAPEDDRVFPHLTRSETLGILRKNGGDLSQELWNAIIAQDPQPARGGGIMHRCWFPKLPEDPGVYVNSAVAWDFGATEGEGDPSAWQMGGRTAEGLSILRHGGRGWKSPGGLLRLIAAVMFLYYRLDPRPTIALPVALADAGKIAFDGQRSYLRRMAVAAGIPSPTIRARTIRTVGRSDIFKSPKHARVAYSGGSLAEAAEPADWDSEAVPPVVRIPGDVRVVAGGWRWPPFSEIVSDLEERKKKEPELAQIERYYRAVARQCSEGDMKALNVDTGDPAEGVIYELHGFSGYDGGADNWVDAAADMHTELNRGAGQWSTFTV